MSLVRFNNRFDSQLNRFNDWNFLFDSSSMIQPSVNIIETEKSFEIEMAVPGYEKKDIAINVENNVLTVSHEHIDEAESEHYRFAKREFSYGSFTRSFSLSRWVEIDNIRASFENGILKIEIPKKSEAIAKPAREIKIN